MIDFSKPSNVNALATIHRFAPIFSLRREGEIFRAEALTDPPGTPEVSAKAIFFDDTDEGAFIGLAQMIKGALEAKC